MTAKPFFHGTFTVRRTWNTAPDRIFAAWSEPKLKAQWFRGPPGIWTETRRTMDFRVGGIDITEGRFGDTGETTLFTSRYHLIEPDSRLAYVFDLHLDGIHHSVTLASLDLVEDDGWTQVTYTEQIAFLGRGDGVEMRREGTEWQFETIARLIQAEEKET